MDLRDGTGPLARQARRNERRRAKKRAAKQGTEHVDPPPNTTRMIIPPHIQALTDQLKN